MDGRPSTELVVVGAHLPGMALEHQLLGLGARFDRYAKTMPYYRLFRLPGEPARPGLLRVGPGDPGYAIEVGVWRLSHEALGRFCALVPSPLCLGWLVLEDRPLAFGFLCEAWATAEAEEISRSGGWRSYLSAGGT